MKALSKMFDKSLAAVKGLKDQVETTRLDRLRALERRAIVANTPRSRAEVEAIIEKRLTVAEVAARHHYNAADFASPHNFEVNTDRAFKLFPEGMFCAIGLRDIVKTAMVNDAMRLAGVPGIDDAERKAKLRAIDAEIREAEIIEEGLIRLCDEAGINVHRREDVDPALIVAEDLGALQGR